MFVAWTHAARIGVRMPSSEQTAITTLARYPLCASACVVSLSSTAWLSTHTERRTVIDHRASSTSGSQCCASMDEWTNGRMDGRIHECADGYISARSVANPCQSPQTTTTRASCNESNNKQQQQQQQQEQATATHNQHIHRQIMTELTSGGASPDYSRSPLLSPLSFLSAAGVRRANNDQRRSRRHASLLPNSAILSVLAPESARLAHDARLLAHLLCHGSSVRLVSMLRWRTPRLRVPLRTVSRHRVSLFAFCLSALWPLLLLTLGLHTRAAGRTHKNPHAIVVLLRRLLHLLRPPSPPSSPSSSPSSSSPPLSIPSTLRGRCPVRAPEPIVCDCTTWLAHSAAQRRPIRSPAPSSSQRTVRAQTRSGRPSTAVAGS